MNCERWTLIHTVCGWILAVGRITYYSLKLRRSQKWCTQADRVNHCLFVFFVLFSTFLVAAVYRTRSRQALIKFHDFLLFRVRFQYRFFVGVSVLVLLLLRSIASKYNKFNPIQSNNGPKVFTGSRRHFYEPAEKALLFHFAIILSDFFVARFLSFFIRAYSVLQLNWPVFVFDVHLLKCDRIEICGRSITIWLLYRLLNSWFGRSLCDLSPNHWTFV